MSSITLTDKQIQRIITEPFFSADVESDGPCPPMNSLLSIGCVSFTLGRGIISRFEQNFELLPDAKSDPKTDLFWAKHGEAYARGRVDAAPPREAIWNFVRWVDREQGELRDPVLATIADEPLDGSGQPNLAAYPAGYDFTMLYWYCYHFLGFFPFGHQEWDGKSYASAVLGLPFRWTAKRNMPQHWFTYQNPMPHVAVYDAESQAHIFINMMCEHLGLPNPLSTNPVSAPDEKVLIPNQ